MANSNEGENSHMHPVWPYGRFMPPTFPPPNMNMPYMLPRNMSYGHVPIYQNMSNVPSASVNSNQQQQQQSTSTSQRLQLLQTLPSQHQLQPNCNIRDPKKMSIQIGSQCVNQTSQVNATSINDIYTSTDKLNAYFEQIQTVKPEDQQPIQSSPMLGAIKAKNMCPPVGFPSNLGAGEPSHATISHDKIEELKNIAQIGCDIAEKLAYNHRNRPCFKKIDSLCARMKQDLIRPDGVLPNINSQGVAWAVKDFIFVFTRAVNAWIIIKGYVYNTPEGLDKVRSALSPNFDRSFAVWQDATINFVENLIESFVNLDNLVQAQKNSYQKAANTTTPVKSVNEESTDLINTANDSYGSPKDTNSNSNYKLIIDDSNGAQNQNLRKGTYFKTGTYDFVHRESLANATESLNQSFDIDTSNETIKPYDNSPQKTTPTKHFEQTSNYITVLESNSQDPFDLDSPRKLDENFKYMLNVFLGRIMQLENGNIFLQASFCRNYYPDFILQTPEFKDVRAIMLKCQTGNYGHIFELVHDVRKIIFQVKKYLKNNPHNCLREYITAFETEVNTIFSDKAFQIYKFDHITGNPNEVLF